LNAKIGENSKYIIFTAIVVGIGFLIYGAYTYWDTSRGINKIEEERERVARILQGTETISDPSAIALSDIERRRRREELVDEQNLAVRFVGIGIALLAAAWLIRDFVFVRFRKRLAQAAAEDKSSP
jgi:uncharacterized membrane protein YidH (DUF202 family)